MVPFNGAPLAVNSTMGGHTPIAFTALPPAIGNIKDGSVRGIAILAKQRVAALPDLPTNIEEGVPGLESDTLTGIVAPAGTPQAIVDKWNAAIVKMAADPAIKKKLDTLGFVPVASSPVGIRRPHQDRSGALGQSGEDGRDSYGLAATTPIPARGERSAAGGDSCASSTSAKPRSRCNRRSPIRASTFPR